MVAREGDFVRSFVGMHRQMSRFLDEVFRYGRPPSFTAQQCWSPPVDVFETDTAYVVKLEIAGIDRQGLEVTFNDGQLTVEGVRRDFSPHTKVICHQMEIPYGPFKRSIFISRRIDVDHISADYVAGFLEICLPRSDVRRKKKVEIKVE